jgi:hypothetical protein
MQPVHDTPAIPIALTESAQRQVEIGEETQALMEHPGWEHLKAAAAVRQRMLTSSLMALSGSSEPARYADLTGQMKGVGEIESIARGLIDVGDQAKAQTREAEIERES